MKRRWLLVAVMAVGIFGASAGQAAAATGPTPTLDCVVNGGSDGNGGTVYTAYFGYVDNDPLGDNIQVGDTNLVTPNGSGFAGQPTTFDQGTYPSVFSASFATSITPTISWVLNGIVVTASATSTPCTAGSTGTASAVTTTSATLDGVVDSLGDSTSYYFEWGTDPTALQSTPVQTVSANDPQLVTANISGLAPGTTYYYELVADNGRVQTTGTEQTFMTATPAAPNTAAAVSLSAQASSATDTGGKLLRDTFTATNSGTATATGVTVTVVLPSGVRLDNFAGALCNASGTTLLTCSLQDLAPGAQETFEVAVVPSTSTELRTFGFLTTASANANTTGDLVTLSTPAASGKSGSARAHRHRDKHSKHPKRTHKKKRHAGGRTRGKHRR